MVELKKEERRGGEMNGRRRKMKGGGGSFCIPGLSGKRVSPVSLLERFRQVVFRLIMLSTISKSSTQQTRPSSCGANESRPYPRGDSHYSEAVADCIEFIKKTASEEGDGSVRDSVTESNALPFVASHVVM